MSKPVIGLLLGAALGLLDGLAAFRTPAVASIMATILFGSTLKGLVTGLSVGFFARKYQSLPLGIAVGLAIGLGLSFVAAAATPDPAGRHYYVAIMLPGGVLGLVCGLATQKLGRRPA